MNFNANEKVKKLKTKKIANLEVKNSFVVLSEFNLFHKLAKYGDRFFLHLNSLYIYICQFLDLSVEEDYNK